MPKQLTIALVAGERSGDIIGANFISAFKQQMASLNVEVKFEGIGGPLMLDQGMQSFFDMEELAVMGLVEVLGRLPRLLKIRKQLFQHWQQNPPDLFMGIDAPDFNLTLEEKLKNIGIKTVHYVSPSIWAWRQKRVFKVKRAVDMVLTLLPFENQFYHKYQVPCAFVGHTLADQIPMHTDKVQCKRALGLQPEQDYIAILPGSRSSEVAMLTEDFAKACAKLANSNPNLKFIAAAVNESKQAYIQDIFKQIAPKLDIQVVLGQSREVMGAANAIMIASGTATLEAALIKRPMVVCYRFKALSYQIFKRLVKVKFFSLPNLIMDKAVVAELLQHQVTPENIVAELNKVMFDENQQQMADFHSIHQQLKQDAGVKAAQTIKNLLYAS
ncbi:lipid-A-disaccharide synthase [Catenovulum agarivorans DS-2]|uniref:Lipid-A-disaccharide synthase n=1 Tax=Catenovulum agarivorans DS-2 TaxID=1328313 RepID=W7QHF5_9ALTE|nr:lipid-A-disaccharide synthase [Catenovulum agarivorans]EWH11306.1 lipid-A-disaccharide synthase [Catenovulum agarivorans DS-2]